MVNGKDFFELQRSIACCLLIVGNKPEKVKKMLRSMGLSSDDFFSAPVKAVIEEAEESYTVDIVTAASRIKDDKQSVSKIADLLNAVPTASNFDRYVQLYKKELYEYRLEEYSKEIKSDNKLDSVAKSRAFSEKADYFASKYLNDEAKGNWENDLYDLMQYIDHGEAPDLVQTGWDVFDKLHQGGLLPNELVIIAARPGCGKTAAALQICKNCKSKVVLFSLEMNKRQILARFLSSYAGFSTSKALRNPKHMQIWEKEKLLEASLQVSELAKTVRIYDDSNQTLSTISAIARREVENGAKLLLIDYLQLITPEGKADTREREVSAISRGLKNLSKELDIPIIVLAQLNRQSENEKTPKLSNLRESGSIEQDANSVLFLSELKKLEGFTRKEGEKFVAATLAKGRDVGTGSEKLVFNTYSQTFHMLTDRKEDF